mgnify:CR=1 FL=1
MRVVAVTFLTGMPFMRFSDNQIRRLAETVLTELLERGGARLKAERGVVQARIEAIVRANLTQEEDLDRQAEKLLEAHLRSAPPGVDRQKLLAMIKKKLAEEKGVPL